MVCLNAGRVSDLRSWAGSEADCEYPLCGRHFAVFLMNRMEENPMDSEKNLDSIVTDSVAKVVLKNAIPAVLAMLMVLVYNLADTFFIGQTHDDLQVAAVSLATPVFLIFMSLGSVFGIGGTSVISRAFGEGRKEYARKVSSFCMWGCVGIGILVSALFLIFMDEILALIGVSAATWELAKNYLTIVSLCGPFVLVANCFSNVLRAEGQPNKAMMGMLMGNLLNVILDPIMILLLGWNITGAAVATVIGNVVGALYYIIYFLRGSSSLSVNIRDFTVKNKVCSSVLVIGIPASLSSLLMSLSSIITNSIMSEYGDMAIAGIGVGIKVTMITGMIAIGLGQGVQPLLGFCVGRRNWERYSKILRFSLVLSFGVGIVLTGFCYLGINGIVSAFLTQPEAFDYGVEFSKILLTTSFLFGPLYCLINALQAMGAAVSSLIINISRQGIIYIPAAYLLNYTLGIDGVVWAQPVADVLAIVLAIILYSVVLWKQKRKTVEIRQERESSAEMETTKVQNHLKRPVVITIGRSYGAGGRSVGRMVAERLNIPFYDKEILLSVAEESGLDQQYVEQIEEKASRHQSRDAYAAKGYSTSQVFLGDYPTHSMEDIAYRAQKTVIEQIAAKGSCVIIGRRADQILRRSGTNLFSIFVTASKAERASRIAARENQTVEEAKKKIRRIDKERAEYYNSLSDDLWGMADTYDLCINMGKIDLNEATELVIKIITEKGGVR